MRTTLDLDDDVLLVAKSLSTRQGQSMGKVVSGLIRQALVPRRAPRMRNGVPLFTPIKGKAAPGLDLVNRLRDEEP